MMPPRNEPIAIIGSGCRFPGNANSPSRLWDLLREPKDCLSEIPKDRFNWEGYYADGPLHGSNKTKYSHFLEDIRRFDPQFFNIQPAEAEAIDPQQRLLLETVYEGLENAGLTIEGLQGSPTAVYVGMMSCDYTDLVQGDIDCAPKYTGTGISRSIHSNRISYFFDWHGPSMTIDTACSSSMMAVHLAVQSLRSGESNVAVACGASLIISPQNYVVLSNLSMISADGRAKMWDDSADGYARDEGVAAVVLKTLSAAIADGDPIDCIIRETGVNQDGRTRGITMPSSIAQADLIRNTYQRAGLDISKRADRPQYFEAHGTGTQVGDPRESEAVHNAFFGGREEELQEADAIHIGSIKTIIGHTEGTAGLAGLLKAALAIKNGYIPPNMLFNSMNPAVAPYAKHLRLPTTLKPWPTLPNGAVRRASVNSFGFGGSNGHAILESYTDTRGLKPLVEEHTSILTTPFVFSAQSERTLISVLRSFSEYLRSGAHLDLHSIAWSLQYKRSILGVRTAFAAHCLDDLLSKLNDKLKSSTETAIGVKPTLKRGARILGELLKASPKAREIHDRPSWTVEEELMKDAEASRIGEAAISQPLCTAVQIILVNMLSSAGAVFHAVVGHSSGEIGAAYAAGLLTASDAIRIAYYRGVYARLAAGLSPSEACGLCESPHFHGRLSVAACNSAASLELDEKKIFARLLRVDTAYHSHHMLPCAQPYLEALQSCDIRPRPTQVEGPSPVWISTRSDLSGDYWAANMTQSVLFAGAVEAAVAMPGGPFDLGLETIQATGKNDLSVFAEALGTLWAHGERAMVDFANYDRTFFSNATDVSFIRDLPTYPWDHERSYWFEARSERARRNRNGPVHRLLGVPYGDSTDTETRWRNFLIPKEMPWLSDHRLQDRAVLPGAAYAVMACEAALLKAQTSEVRLIEIHNLAIHRAISFDDETTEIEVVFTLSNLERVRKGPTEGAITATWAVQSPTNKDTDKLSLVSSGSISLLLGEPESSVLPGRTVEDSLPNMVDVDLDEFYDWLFDLGYGYKEAFRAIHRLERKAGHSTGWFEPQSAPRDAIVHPALLDVAFQALFAAVSYPGDGGLWSLHVPTGIRAIRLNPYHIHTTGTMFFDGTLPNALENGDVTIYTSAGDAFIQVESVASVPFKKATKADDRNIFSEEVWAASNPDANSVVIERATSYELGRADACERASRFYMRRLTAVITASEQHNAAPHHKRLLAWAAHLVTEFSCGTQSRYKAEWANDTEEDILQLFETYPDDIDLRVIRSLGDAYPSIVRGESDALEILTNGNMLQELYTGGLGFSVANRWAAQLVKQISHRYPHMDIIDLGAGTTGATQSLLGYLDSAFKSYTYSDVSAAFSDDTHELFDAVKNKMVFKSLDIEKDPKDQGYEKNAYDLVIALNVIHTAKNMKKALKNIHSLLKPGGYLVLFELTGEEASRIDFMMGGLPGWWRGQEGGSESRAPTLTTAQWHTLLQKTGFSGIDTIAMSEQDGLAFPFSVFVTQAVDDHVAFLRQPLFIRDTDIVAEEMGDLLIVGGTTLKTSRLSAEVRFMLSPHFRTKMVVETLEEVNGLAEDEKLPTTILVLTELEAPMFRDMTADRLQSVKTILTNYRNVLWVTRGCQGTEPYSNMTVGLGRCASNEQKELRLQFLDVSESFSTGAPDGRRLSEMLLRLRVTQLWERENALDRMLWTTEPEFRTTKDDTLVIPRMYQNEAQNNRYNSKQRQISYPVNPAVESVSIAYSEPSAAFRLVSKALPSTRSSSEGLVSIRVVCSLLSALRVASGLYLFAVIGRRTDTQDTVFALSTSNDSLVQVHQDYTISIRKPSGSEKAIILRFAWELLIHAVVSNANAGDHILCRGINGDQLQVLCRYANRQGISILMVTDDSRLMGETNSIFIHPLEFKNVLKAKLPSTVSGFLDLSASDIVEDNLHKHLISALPASCQVYTASSLFSTFSVFSERSLHKAVQGLGLHELLDSIPTHAHGDNYDGYNFMADSLTSTLSQVPQLSPEMEDRFTIIDWIADYTVLVDYEPVDKGIAFSPAKTYLLVGLTGDLGQSLCEWFVDHGARNLVLTSRNPKIGQKWLDIMTGAGATVKVYTMDVTKKTSIEAVFVEICQTLPPIAGVANAAMVMQDIMLSNMNLDDLQTVMKPKVDGSRYLHEIFGHSHPLDFFILFSSLSTIIGNSGQGNYSASNAYMAALVAQRRAQGLAGSVMHIGAIIGAGYITRAGQLRSGDLEAFGSYPLAPADFHQLFGEAVLASPPHSGRKPDITTGLRVIDPEINDRVLWRSNVKFSHFWKTEEDETRSDGHDKRSMAPVKAQLAEATTMAQAGQIIQASFSARLVVLLQLNLDDMDDAVPLVELGVDSLVAVEARAWFTKQLNIDISVLRILGGACVLDLVADVLGRLGADLLPNVRSGVDEERPVLPNNEALLDKKEDEAFTAQPSPSFTSVQLLDDTLSSSQEGSPGQALTPTTTSSELDKPLVKFLPVVLRKEPMSYAQSRFWFLRHSVEDKTAFNITFSHCLRGDVHPDLLANAVKRAASMHEGLRTCFFEENNVPMQGVMEASPLYLEVRQIQSEDEAKAEYDRLSQHEYDLETGQSMRAVLLEQVPSHLFYLIVGYHHIAMDGAGFMGSLQELMRIGGGEPMPKPIQYADYSKQLRMDVESGMLEGQLSYWRKQFGEGNPPPVLPLLPFSRVKVRTPLRSYSSSSISVRLESNLVARIKRRSRNFHATAFHFYLAVFRTMLLRFLGVDDLCIGIADSNRSDAELQRTMGILVNLLPLRFKSPHSSTMTFGDAVKEARSTAYAALGNSRLPFNALLDNITVERSSTHHPLFQVFLDYRPGIPESWQLGDVDVQRLDWSYGKNAYDISLDIMENTNGTAVITINTQEYLYGQPEVEILMKVFVNLLEAFSRNPALRLNEPSLSLFSESDTQAALALARGPDAPSDWPATLPQRVEEVAHAHGDSVAVCDGNSNQITYHQMIEQMHEIVHALIEAGVKASDRVALLQRPAALTISCLMAILHLGAVYVPLDLRSPVARLRNILRDCQPRAIIYDATIEGDASLLTQEDTTSISLVNASAISPRPVPRYLPSIASSEVEAVILYTSGSTGTPKGVILTHSAIKNVVEMLTKQYQLGAEVVLQQSALTFDLSLNQIFVALANGGTLHLVDQSKRGDAVEVARLIKEAGITYTMATPSEYSYWIRFGANDLQLAKRWTLAFSLGEELKRRLAEEFRSLDKPDLRLINTYGPAEVTVHSHTVEIPYKDQIIGQIPVGHTLPNYSVYILDESHKAVPLGMPGEICVGGAGISRGYLNLDTLTNERFVQNPFTPAEWEAKGWDRLYLTGDRGRLRADGALLFEGRMEGSSQIKLRGLRVELGEIEHAILNAAAPAIDEVAVSVRGQGDSADEYLVAHATFSRHSSLGIESEEDRQNFLRQLLSRLPLPQYMVPAMIIPIDSMPLTNHNKVDRKAIAALPLPSTDLGPDKHAAAQLTELESNLVRVWETVLSKELGIVLSPDVSFFHVGGNSLLLIPLQYMIKDTFHATLAMADFADAHTVRKMAAFIEQTMSLEPIDWPAETAVHPDSLLSSIPSEKGGPGSGIRFGKNLRVLYTGATGHSAMYILEKLVKDERVSKIYCVAVRSPDKLSIVSEKIVQFPGDLLGKRLGLTEEQFDFLEDEVDVIFHAAANRSFWDSYQVMRRANVLPAQTLAALAARRKVPIHFMSSAAVHLFGGRIDGDSPQTPATYPPPADGKDGYLASKWAAEKVFENASSSYGLPIYIHRPAPVRKQISQVDEGNLFKETVFAELMRVAQELRLHVPKGSIKGEIDLLDLRGLSGVLSDVIIRSTREEDRYPSVRYIHHHADMKLHLDEWESYAEEHQDELPPVEMMEMHNATEWIARAKRIGFPFMLSAQNFDLSGGGSRLPILQRR
ncbi:putative hybrid PKS/NRPS enzyme EqiS-like protein, partial [Aspergillus floccosus]